MGLEVANFIAGLDQTWPTGLDPVNKGDDHLRLIKHVLKDTFPGVDEEGFAIPIVATEDELNFVKGVTSAIQTQIDDLGAFAALGPVPIGGVIMFNAAFAGIPVNWQLCDGTNGTPNMVNQFVYGTVTESELLDAGGSADSIIPTHQHDPAGDVTPTAAQASHNHGWTGGEGNGHPDGSDDSIAPGDADSYPRITQQDSQIPAITVDPIGDHQHPSAGEDPAGKNIPPYIKLAYIQRMA